MRRIAFTSNRLLAVLVVLTLAAGMAWAAAEAEQAAGMEKEMVLDPTTGAMVTAPEYGGTLTYALRGDPPNPDTFYRHPPAMVAALVVEKLGMANMGVDRNYFDFRTNYLPDDIVVGRLAESWEQPDSTTVVFNIRSGVHWHDKAPMNGRELTAEDVVFNFHRYLGLGSGFTEVPEGVAGVAPPLTKGGITSVSADGNQVTFKLDRPNLDIVKTLLIQNIAFVYPPEVIMEHGDVADWRNLVGTGPFELVDWVEASSVTFNKAPNYWKHDERFPDNQLPYVDELVALVMPEPQTRVAALRSGKVDFIGYSGSSQVTGIDLVESIKKSNPDIVLQPYSYRSETSPIINVNRPPFDDVRVRHALQMALDIESWGETYFKGYASLRPQGWLGDGLTGYASTWDDWPDEIKGYYSYDPEGAEALLDAAGLPRGDDGTRFKLEFMISAGDDRGWKELIADGWRKVGIDVTLVVPDGAEMGQRTAALEYDIRSGISGYEWNPIGQLLHWTTNPGAWNPAGVADPVYDAMVEEVQAATNMEDRQRLARAAAQYLVDGHWVIWGARVPHFSAHWPWVKGFNGESEAGDMDRALLFSRMWLDQDLKKELGF